jgi:hypothetical protein
MISKILYLDGQKFEILLEVEFDEKRRLKGQRHIQKWHKCWFLSPSKKYQQFDSENIKTNATNDEIFIMERIFVIAVPFIYNPGKIELREVLPEDELTELRLLWKKLWENDHSKGCCNIS